MPDNISNRDIARMFDNIAILLEIRGENRFKVLAYRRAAENISEAGIDLALLDREGRLKEVPGIGEALAEKIDEIVRTGNLAFYDDLIREVPEGLLEIVEVPGMGPRRARLVWKELGITSLSALEKAAVEERLRKLPGFGARIEGSILAGIRSLKDHRRTSRIPLGDAWEMAEIILKGLKEVDEVERISVAGSLRRGRETVGDLDILVASRGGTEVMNRFIGLPIVEGVLLRGETKTSVRLRGGLQVDMRVVEPERWGTALQYFTGSQEHNVQLRELSLKRGYSLSEYALTPMDGGGEILCREEDEVYRILKLLPIPPELREGRGEIDAALRGELPELVEEFQLLGDLHCHSSWSDGRADILEMAEAAMRRGLNYLMISDHSKGLAVAGGLSEKELIMQRKEVERVNERLRGRFTVLHGVEVEILADGGLDFSDGVLERFDLVIAAIHTAFHQDRKRITSRYLGAMANPHVDILAHPTTRLLGRRSEVDADWERIFEAASDSGILLEINANPRRLDLPDRLVRQARKHGCLFVISSDSHAPGNMEFLKFGVEVARRGWLTSDDVVNTWSLDRVLDEGRRRR